MAGEHGQKLTKEQREDLARGFAEVINCNSIENLSDTPDFILGEYLVNCLEAYHDIHQHRQKWYGKAEDKINDAPNPTSQEIN